MTARSKLDLLVGKSFIAPYTYADGVVVAVLDEDYCFVRFEASADGPRKRSPWSRSVTWRRLGTAARRTRCRPGCSLIVRNSARNTERGSIIPVDRIKTRIVPLRRKDEP
jgi:hypothetical protein